MSVLKPSSLKKFKHDTVIYLLSFFIPVVIMLIIYIARGIYPFGENCFLRTDMYHQYAPFFSEFYNKLKSGNIVPDMFYSWNIGMGVNFVALYAYYLASPVNWLIFLCPQSNIIEFMSILIIAKISFASLAMCIYLSKHFDSKHMTMVAFSVFYGMSSYIAAYSWNIMWLDCIMLLPIIVLNLERLVKYDKCFWYCITLGFTIISNYYIAIMICIFLTMYFIGFLITEKIQNRDMKFIKKIFNFAVFSLIAGGLAAFLILPEFFALQLTTSGNIDFPNRLSTYFTLFDAFSRHLMNVETSVLSGNYPNIYCGVIILAMIPLYILNKSIDRNEKIFKIILISIIMISFNMNMPNFIWHGFHFPNSLPCRQSFIYIFLILIISYEAFYKIQYLSDREVCFSFWLTIAFVIMVEKLVDNFDFSIIYYSLLFIAIYFLIVHIYRNNKILCSKRKFILLMTVFISVSSLEAAINMEATSVSTTSRKNYLKDSETVKNLTSNIDNEYFYRIEKMYRRTKNDSAWHNIKGASVFSSTASESVTKLFGDLGFVHSTNAYSFEGYTPLTSAIFAVKYMISNKYFDSTDYLEYVSGDGETYLYKNNYSLPLGFVVNSEIEKLPAVKNNPFLMQNDFVSKAVDSAPIFVPLDTSINNDITTIYNDRDQQVFIYVQSTNVEKINVNYDGTSSEYNLDKKQQIVDLGFCDSNKIIEVKNSEDNTLKIIAYGFNSQNFKDAYEKLKLNPLEVELKNSSNTAIVGNVNAATDGRLFTSIPYDDGWSVQIDSKPADILKFRDAFIMLDMPKGNHTVKFEYMPKGLKAGSAISALSFIFLIFSLFVSKLPKKIS